MMLDKATYDEMMKDIPRAKISAMKAVKAARVGGTVAEKAMKATVQELVY